jgi:hypothetical protein
MDIRTYRVFCDENEIDGKAIQLHVSQPGPEPSLFDTMAYVVGSVSYARSGQTVVGTSQRLPAGLYFGPDGTKP